MSRHECNDEKIRRQKRGKRVHLGMPLEGDLFDYACMGISQRRYYYRVSLLKEVTCTNCKVAAKNHLWNHAEALALRVIN